MLAALQPRLLAILSQALRAALRRRRLGAAASSPTSTPRASEGGYDDNSTEANYAINCLDDPYAIPSARCRPTCPAFEKASPTFGRIFAWGLTTCRGVRLRRTEQPPTFRGAGAAPIVVVGTTRDPATPLPLGRAPGRELESGVLVTRDGDGHTGYNAGNACVDGAVEDYLIDGTVPAGRADLPTCRRQPVNRSADQLVDARVGVGVADHTRLSRPSMPTGTSPATVTRRTSRRWLPKSATA